MLKRPGSPEVSLVTVTLQTQHLKTCVASMQDEGQATHDQREQESIRPKYAQAQGRPCDPCQSARTRSKDTHQTSDCLGHR